MFRLILTASLAALPTMVAGQTTIYKVQMPDGSVLYSDSVPPGGKVLEERESKATPRVAALPGKGAPPGKGLQPLPGAAPSAAPALPPGGGAQAPALVRPPNPNTRPGGGSDNVSNLERDLAVAKRSLELGREPLPGERRGLAGGGSRLTPEYEARIAAMEREIAATEEKLKRAYATR